MSTTTIHVSTAVIGYTSIFALSVWALIGSFFRKEHSPKWNYFHKATYFVAPFLAILSFILLLSDIAQ
jgi:hypothetical protein